MSLPTKNRMRLIHATLVAGWAIAVCFGWYSLNSYGAGQGTRAAAAIDFPKGMLTTQDAASRQLVMFAHPRCPCTRASLLELSKLVEQLNVKATVVFWQPTTSGLNLEDASDWQKSPTITLAENDVNLSVEFDPNGEIQKQFGAATSGHCFVYDRAGHLRFSGGITSGRGHQGANESHQIITKLMANQLATNSLASVHEFPVFGCQITE